MERRGRTGCPERMLWAQAVNAGSVRCLHKPLCRCRGRDGSLRAPRSSEAPGTASTLTRGGRLPGGAARRRQVRSRPGAVLMPHWSRWPSSRCCVSPASVARPCPVHRAPGQRLRSRMQAGSGPGLCGSKRLPSSWVALAQPQSRGTPWIFPVGTRAQTSSPVLQASGMTGGPKEAYERGRGCGGNHFGQKPGSRVPSWPWASGRNPCSLSLPICRVGPSLPVPGSNALTANRDQNGLCQGLFSLLTNTCISFCRFWNNLTQAWWRPQRRFIPTLLEVAGLTGLTSGCGRASSSRRPQGRICFSPFRF